MGQILRRKAGQDAGRIKEDLKMKEMAKEAAQAKKGTHPHLQIQIQIQPPERRCH
jgi:hypothetical protein